MTIKSAVISAMLGLMFLSLLAIFMTNPTNTMILFLCVLIMLVGLIMSQNRGWRDIAILASIAVTVSIVAVALLVRARFGVVGTLIAVLIWSFVLSAIFSWGRRNILTVTKDRAILIRNNYSGQIQVVEGPIAPPLIPMVDTKIAVIPRYELSVDVQVEKVNTKRFNIDAIGVHVHYKVVSPQRALSGIPNRGQAQFKIAQELKKDLAEARLDVTFWEKLLNQQMCMEVADIVREVAYNNVYAQNPVEVYGKRADLISLVHERLQHQVSRWGVDISSLDFERVDVNFDIFKRINKASAREDLTTEKRLEAEREAERIKLTGEAHAKVEAVRVSELVRALKEANVNLSAEDLHEIVIDAIRAAADVEYESSFTRLAGPHST